MQLHKLALCGLFCTLFIFLSCDKENQENGTNDETWYFYDQTKCADVWDTYLINTTYEGLIEYHFSEFTEVTIEEVQIVDDGAVAQDCEACNCTTGTKIRVRAALEFQAMMAAEGFGLE